MVRGMQVWTSQNVPVCIYVPGAGGKPLVGKKKDYGQMGLG